MKTARDFGLLQEPQHEDIYPVEISEERFVGKRGPLRGGIIEMSHALQASRMKPVRRKPLYNIGSDYTVHAARYSDDPDTHAITLKNFGPGVVTLFDEDLIVGAARKHFIWVHPKHHGQDMAVEMAIAWFLYYGYEAWTFKQDKPYNYTEAGFAFRKRQYQTMVERGIVRAP